MPPRVKIKSTRNLPRNDIRLMNFVEKILQKRGYTYVEENFETLQPSLTPLYTKLDMNGNGVFGTGYRVSFIVFNPNSYPNTFCIQCRWQGISGSTDRKLAFDVDSIRIGRYETVALIGGPELKQSVEDWLRRCSGKRKLNRIFRPREFYYFSKGSEFENLGDSKIQLFDEIHLVELKEIVKRSWNFLKQKFKIF